MHTTENRHSSTARVHKMPFGSTVLPDGRVQFRLWAPSSNTVELCLFEGSEEKQRVAMQRDGEWYQTESSAASVGMDYQFFIDGATLVPDPASRRQPDDVHGRSRIIDPTEFVWNDQNWQGKPWSSTILYELHVGSFTAEGTFSAVAEKLDYLKELGVTAVELMPVADFPGQWGWGYDGVLPYAPESKYGSVDDLKRLIQAAHHKELMVFLDVVYNHFGPEGNYLYVYAKKFFTEKHKTPWGAAIDFEDLKVVRDFFIENALYWLEEFNFDGLRLDAVHAIKDESERHFLEELAQRVKDGPGKIRKRHLVLENDDNTARLLERDADGTEPTFYTAQWNDDIHHAYHVLATDETGGYYSDYVKNESGRNTVELLHRGLTEGFIYQGDASAYKDGERRGEVSKHLPPAAFVSFLQNHDQVGNRAFGDRIASITEPERLRALTALQLLAPGVPLIFMGEEWGARTPFYYFCDLGAELAPLVTAGRRNEFAKFAEFSDPKVRESIPDPCVQKTFVDSKLNWHNLDSAEHSSWHKHYQELLKIRTAKVAPLLDGLSLKESSTADGTISISWHHKDGSVLALFSNLSSSPKTFKEKILADQMHPLECIYSTQGHGEAEIRSGKLPAWSVFVFTSTKSGDQKQ